MQRILAANDIEKLEMRHHFVQWLSYWRCSLGNLQRRVEFVIVIRRKEICMVRNCESVLKILCLEWWSRSKLGPPFVVLPIFIRNNGNICIYHRMDGKCSLVNENFQKPIFHVLYLEFRIQTKWPKRKQTRNPNVCLSLSSLLFHSFWNNHHNHHKKYHNTYLSTSKQVGTVHTS